MHAYYLFFMIHILWPTVRYEAAAQMATLWYERAADKSSHRFLFGVNKNPNIAIVPDPCDVLNSIGAVAFVFDQPAHRKGCCWVSTKLSKAVGGRADISKDTIILASDDWEAPQNWDCHVTEQMADGTNFLIANDGYAPETNIIGLPIVSATALKLLNGIIYNPVYCHMFSDQELYYIAKELGGVKNLRGSGCESFVHKHWCFDKRTRDEHDQANHENWQRDNDTYEARKNLSLAEKLKLPDFWIE